MSASDGGGLWDGVTRTVDSVARSRLGQITSALSVSVLGVDFLSNPEGFVVASVINWILGFFVGLAGQVAVILRDSVIGTFVDAVASAGAVVLDPFALAGDVVVDLVGSVEALSVGLAANAGPLGFLAPVVAWAVVALAVGALVSLIRKVILWVT